MKTLASKSAYASVGSILPPFGDAAVEPRQGLQLRDGFDGHRLPFLEDDCERFAAARHPVE